MKDKRLWERVNRIIDNVDEKFDAVDRDASIRQNAVWGKIEEEREAVEAELKELRSYVYKIQDQLHNHDHMNYAGLNPESKPVILRKLVDE